MSLRHGLLGLLAEAPASGYDLAGRFQTLLGPVWPAQHPKIYSELTHLADEGLIEVDSVGPRRRKAYRITDEGLAEVRRWLRDEVDHTVRFESVLRSFFFWLMTPEELDGHLAEEGRFFAGTAELFRRHAAAKDRGEYGSSAAVQSSRVAIEAGIRLYEAMAAWSEWARTVPPATGTQLAGVEAAPEPSAG